MAKQPEKLTIEFRGRTESEIDFKFMNWQRDTAGQVRVIEKHPIKSLPIPMRITKFGHPPLGDAPDAFSMPVEYETATVGDDGPNKRKKRRTRKRS